MREVDNVKVKVGNVFFYRKSSGNREVCPPGLPTRD